MSAENDALPAGVAIVGMNCRFPRAKNVGQFWHNLREGVECISFFTDEELLAAGVEPSALRNPKYVKAKGIVEDVDLFDAAFFNIPPKEADVIDPQQRIFLECAWEALEGAGYTADNYEGLVAVFAGVGPNYYVSHVQANRERVESLGWYKLAIGNEKDHLTTRVSYALDLRGPSFNVQSACSTSLVAIHLACQGLLDYQFDMALAGGATIHVKPKGGYLHAEGISSPDGHCRAFDARGRGVVSGNGAGVVVLKRLADALADGDTIYAVIKGSAVNNDGYSKAGYAAPSLEGQASVIAMAQAVAEVEPDEIGYVEAHGTATPLGDMIEVAALTQAFRAGSDRKGFCALGSVKSNIGHTDTAAGVAGVIKTALALTHRQIPPSINFDEPNPRIDFANSPFYVNAKLAEWKTSGGRRLAGVSSFGQGGTNAHLVLEEPPAAPPPAPSRPWQLLLLSARSESALEQGTDNLAAHLEGEPGQNFADVAHTLQVGRKTFRHRRMLVCRDAADAAAALKSRDPRRLLGGAEDASSRPVAFMFSGAGEQYVGMGLELYRTEPVFREQVDLCCELLKPQLGLDLRDVLYPESVRGAAPAVDAPGANGLDLRRMLGARPAAGDEASRGLNRTLLAQPALFVIEYALAQLWLSCGVRPRAMIGYSIGEYVAACLAGVFSLEDALALVARRAQLIEGLPGGAMLTVPLAAEEVYPLLGGEVSLAATTGPRVSVLAGPTEAISELERRLEGNTVYRRIPTSHAFHSTMLEPVAAQLADEVRRVRLSPPQIPFVSNVTGKWITEAEATDPIYWAQHMCRPVRFTEGVSSLRETRELLLLEVGPGQSLATSVVQHPTTAAIPDTVAVASLRHSYDAQSDTAFFLNALGRLWLAGVKIDWAGFYGQERRRRVPLPTYPFERQRHWLELKPPTPAHEAARPRLERRADVAEWFYLPVWKQSLARRARAAEAGASGPWLVFEDSCGLGRKLVGRLREAGHAAVTVAPGERFAALDADAYSVNPRDPDDYARLVAELCGRHAAPGRVLHLWSVTGGGPASREGREQFARAQETGFYSLLFLTQALIKAGLAKPPSGHGRPLQLQVVSDNVHRVTGGEVLRPEKATVIGTCKSVPQEYPGISCLSVDVTLPEAGTWQESRLLDSLLAELTAEPSNAVVAYRGADRWVQTFEPVRLEAEAGRPARLREHGVYMLTGGLGKDSLVRARYLAEGLRARLVLVGRTGLPEESEWESWVETHGEQDGLSVKIRKVQELQALGAEVLVVKADVADVAQMRSVLEQVDRRFGALHGVIHAAGVTDAAASRLVLELGRVECEWQFQPKVYGLYVLEEVLRGRELDFCVLTSSVASVVGGVGLLAYTSANIFMDAFAHGHNQRDPVRWLSLNWQGASPENTVEAFKRLLSMPPASQVVVSVQDLQARIEQRIKLDFTRAAGDEGARPAPTSEQGRPNLRNAYVAPGTEAEQQITDIWRDLLGVGWLGVHDSFLEVGGDSLLAVQLISRLNQTFGVELPLRSLFETPTVAGLAATVERLGGAAVSAREEPAAASSLVGIQTGGSRPPFFCVHPSGGNVFCFAQLARRLGDDQPFYALQSKGLNAGDDPHETVEEMAAYYLEAVRGVRPTGPYFLGGWSMGGLVAFEMARQLRERGEEVSLLALLDTKAFNQHRPTEADERTHLINFAQELALSWGLEVTWDDLGLKWEELSHLKPDEQLDSIVARAKAVGAIPADAELFEGRRLLRVFRANAGAMHRYVPPPYPGRLTLVRTGDHAAVVAADPTLGWGRVVAGGVDSYSVGGSHYTIVRDPYVREVARILAAGLEGTRKV
jgi:acyl transferase domain-containing protein/thioesterase domain-containing protein